MDRDLDALCREAWETHYNRIKKFCSYHLHRCPDMVDDDCCQEVFKLYYEALLKNREILNVGAWLSKVAFTEVLRVEKQAAQSQSLEGTISEPSEKQLSVEYNYLEEIIKERFTDEALIDMITDTLTDEEKRIFDGCFLNPRPTNELASELHISANYLYKKKWVLKQKLAVKITEVVRTAEDKILK